MLLAWVAVGAAKVREKQRLNDAKMDAIKTSKEKQSTKKGYKIKVAKKIKSSKSTSRLRYKNYVEILCCCIQKVKSCRCYNVTKNKQKNSTKQEQTKKQQNQDANEEGAAVKRDVT